MKSTLLIWMFHVEVNAPMLTVVKWAVVVNKYVSVTFIYDCCTYPDGTSPINCLWTIEIFGCKLKEKNKLKLCLATQMSDVSPGLYYTSSWSFSSCSLSKVVALTTNRQGRRTILHTYVLNASSTCAQSKLRISYCTKSNPQQCC